MGWLEPPFDFRTGKVSDDFLAQLRSLLEGPWEPVSFMGGQFCRFCEVEAGYSASNLFIPGADSVYVAPEGIVHYIEAHQYLPPEEFQLAVEECPPQDSITYYEALIAAGFPLEDPGSG